jgi:hypothetical protein
VVTGAGEAWAAFQNGDYRNGVEKLFSAGFNAIGLKTSLKESFRVMKGDSRVCFAAGTPLLTEEGDKLIERLTTRDWVWSRNEFDPNGPMVLCRVEEVFISVGRIWHLHVSGEVIRTTGERRYCERDRGWTPCGELRPGDHIADRQGNWLLVEDVCDTGVEEKVLISSSIEFQEIREKRWSGKRPAMRCISTPQFQTLPRVVSMCLRWIRTVVKVIGSREPWCSSR